MGGKNARKFFSRNKLTERAKNVGKKLSQKSAKKRFFIFTSISCPKNGGKNARNNFSRNSTNSASKKCEEKNRRKKVRKNVFYNHTNIVT